MEEPSPRQVQAQVRSRAEAEDSLSRQSRAQQQRQWQAVVRLGRRLRPGVTCSKSGTLPGHPVLKREDRLGKEPFAGFGTVVEDITGSGYTKNQPILLGAF